MQMLLLIGIAAGLTNVRGRMVGDQRQGWAIFGAMAVLPLLGIVTVNWAEAHGNPAFAPYHVDVARSALQAGGNMEGKEVRFGIAPSSSFATITTDAGGAVDAMHDSFMPLGAIHATGGSEWEKHAGARKDDTCARRPPSIGSCGAPRAEDA